MKVLRLPFSIYEKVINLLSVVSLRIPAKVRSILMDIAMLGLLFLGILHYCNPRLQKLAHYTGGGPLNMVNIAVIFIAIIIITGIDGKVDIKKLKFTPVFWFGWFVCFALIFATSLVHKVRITYFSWGIVSLFLYPLIFITWADRFEKLIKIVARNTVAITYAFILMNLVITPMTTRSSPADGYLGVVSNPNGNGMIIAGFFAASLYMLLTSNKWDKGKVIYLISTAFSAMMPIVAGCRSAELAVLLESVFGLLYYFKCVKAGLLRTSFKRVVVILLAIAVIGCAFGAVLSKMDTMDINAYAETRDEAHDNLPNDFAKKIDTASSGRLVVWIAYLRNITLWGKGNPVDPPLEGYRASKSAHNNALDILYASGIFAAIGYLTWVFTCLWWIFRKIFLKDELHIEYLFVILTILAYFTEAMLEVPMHPFTTNLAVLAYMALIPIAIRRAE